MDGIRRIYKKKCRNFMDWFTREKIPLAFQNERERLKYVSAWARSMVGKPAKYPEL